VSTTATTPDDAGIDTTNEADTQSLRAAASAEDVKHLFEPVARLVDECRVHLSSSGVEIRAADPANVAMVDLQADPELFHSFQASEGTLGIPLERLLSVLKMADSDSSLVEFHLDYETRKLLVVVDGVEYSMALLDPQSIRKEPDIPDFEPPASGELGASVLKQGIKATDMVGDSCRLRANRAKESLMISADGDTDSVEYKLGPTDDGLESFAMDDTWQPPSEDSDEPSTDGRPDGLSDEAVQSSFSLDYLKDMRPVLPNDGNLEFTLGDNLPLDLAFSLADGSVDVKYLLAPRIQT
jgi:proliferating cell nuclear antigen